MAKIIDLEAFKKNYLVVGLSADQIRDIAGIADFRRFSPQESLIQAGQTSADLFVILDGKVNVLMPDGDKLAEVGPGHVLGEVAMIDTRPRTANAVAVGLVDCAVFDANVLRNYLNQHREMGFVVMVNLARVLCTRLRDANERIDTLMDQALDVWHHAAD